MSDTRVKSGQNFVGGLEPENEPSHLGWTKLFDKVLELVKKINGRISFGNGKHRNLSGNIDGVWHTMFLPAENIDYQFKHELGRVPVGMILMNCDTDAITVRFSDADLESITVRMTQAGVGAPTNVTITVVIV